MSNAEEIQALKKALSDALVEVRVLRSERDLLKEQLDRFKRQLLDAKSEVSAAHQKDLFFNEAEVEGAQAEPAAAATEDPKNRGAGAPALQARPQAAGSGAATRRAAPRTCRRRAYVPARRCALERDRHGGQRATGYRAAAGARDPPRARQVRLPVAATAACAWLRNRRR